MQFTEITSYIQRRIFIAILLHVKIHRDEHSLAQIKKLFMYLSIQYKTQY